MLAYVICGVLVGIGALFFVATYTTVQPGMAISTTTKQLQAV